MLAALAAGRYVGARATDLAGPERLGSASSSSVSCSGGGLAGGAGGGGAGRAGGARGARLLVRGTGSAARAGRPRGSASRRRRARAAARNAKKKPHVMPTVAPRPSTSGRSKTRHSSRSAAHSARREDHRAVAAGQVEPLVLAAREEQREDAERDEEDRRLDEREDAERADRLSSTSRSPIATLFWYQGRNSVTSSAPAAIPASRWSGRARAASGASTSSLRASGAPLDELAHARVDRRVAGDLARLLERLRARGRGRPGRLRS